jgi:hypothetical protein
MTINKTTKRDTTVTDTGIAQHFTFGVEIETTVPRANNLDIGSYSGNGIQVPYLPAGWVAKYDASINAPSGYEGCEIVSPILKGEDGIRQVIEVCRVLNERGHKVNASCGVHVHVGFRTNPVSGKATSAKELETLVQIASYLEDGLYASTGTQRRRSGTYSKSVKTEGKADRAVRNMASDRYRLLNTTNLSAGGKGTVEFRCFSGSTNATKIVGWIQIALGCVEKALVCKRAPAWDGKKPIGVWNKGEGKKGQTEMERLLAYLCWVNRGAAPAHQRAYGWISNLVSQKDVRKMFRDMAKKYDAGNSEVN